MRGAGGVRLQDVEEECRRSIQVLVHVTNDSGVRRVTDVVSLS
jgi:hypothetical protein